MLRFINQYPRTPIRSLRSGRRIGYLAEPIIDPNDLSIKAFFCDTPTRKEEVVLFTEDIRDYSSEGAIVDSEENIMEVAGLVRLESLLEINFTLIDKKVITNRKRKVGKINDYVLDDTTFKIEKLYVRESIIKSLGKSDLIIGRRQIVEVNDRFVVVRDTDIKVSERQTKAALNLLSNS